MKDDSLERFLKDVIHVYELIDNKDYNNALLFIDVNRVRLNRLEREIVKRSENINHDTHE